MKKSAAQKGTKQGLQLRRKEARAAAQRRKEARAAAQKRKDVRAAALKRKEKGKKRKCQVSSDGKLLFASRFIMFMQACKGSLEAHKSTGVDLPLYRRVHPPV